MITGLGRDPWVRVVDHKCRGRENMGRNYIGHTHIGHSHTDHNLAGRIYNCIGHNYAGHNCMGHSHVDHDCTGREDIGNDHTYVAIILAVTMLYLYRP